MWHNAVLPRLALGIRGRTAANVAFATGYARVFAGEPRWGAASGWRLGLAAAAAVLAGYGAALAVPPARKALAAAPDRAPGVSVAEWIGVHIPLGTVYSEELIFRGTLDDIAGTPLTALAFGLWHLRPARAAGDPVLPTVAATAAAGLVFGALRRKSGSATAPALLHYALNAGGAVAPRLAR
ncbi:CPBP family intramembrane glutamic endopeptidase [Nocardia sp. NPDC057353]|uniref:CPBP family intramembrane glutamic endopeptidase n=1 Tax=Nocardia sp. NPDC057353 TaxID=3346104 RepID=UPI00364341AD